MEELPPQMGHLGRNFRQLLGNQKHLIIVLKFHATKARRARQKEAKGMVFQGDFYRVSCLLFLVYVYDV